MVLINHIHLIHFTTPLTGIQSKMPFFEDFKWLACIHLGHLGPFTEVRQGSTFSLMMFRQAKAFTLKVAPLSGLREVLPPPASHKGQTGMIHRG